jgi:SpoVK/Ycf46/Vps4 family AAA+-type ATPase
MVTRQELEAALLADPFDQALRLEYAQLLATEGDWNASLAQCELMLKSGETAAGLQQAAHCQHRLGRDEAAVDLYVRAKALGDFVADDELEELLRNARPANRLSVIEGDKPDNLVSFVDARQDKVRFTDVAGMDALKKTLRLQIIEPFLNPGLFSRFRKQAGGGVLLYGPPGCGKTLMARAIATECNATFMSVGISDVLNMWLGESERNLALLFEQARANKPCVMFFDELDALAYSRSKSNSTSARTVVNEFLAQLDGFEHNNAEVLILAATNMPWDVDSAMKRPGRFTKQIFVPPPDEEARQVMLEMKLAGVPVGDIDVAAIASATKNYSGADMDGLIDNAKDNALSDILDRGTERSLQQADFVEALEMTNPSTIDWLKTARNLVKYGGADNSYKDVKRYLKNNKLT